MLVTGSYMYDLIVSSKSHSKLSQNELIYSRLGCSFWLCWDAENQDLALKRQGNVVMNRALNCTREMAENHLGMSFPMLKCHAHRM